MQKVINYLKGKEEISLPDLQLDLEMSYKEMLRTHEELSEIGYLSERIDGIRVKVNSLYVSPLELGEDEISECVCEFTLEEFSLLQYLEDLFDRESDVTFENLSYKDGLDQLIRHKIIHEFEEKHYPSVTKDSYDRLNRALRSMIDDAADTGAAIGYPLFMCWTADPEKACELISLPYITEESQEYVDAKINAYKLTKRIPKKPDYDINNKNLLKFEIIESFIGRCTFRTKKEYDTEAEKTLELIKKSDVFPDVIIQVMENATKEIVEELSFKNIMEIRKILGV